MFLKRVLLESFFNPAAFYCGSVDAATFKDALETERALVAKMEIEVKDLQEQLSKRKFHNQLAGSHKELP